MPIAGSLAAPKQHMLPSPRGCGAACTLLFILSSPDMRVVEPSAQGCSGIGEKAHPIHSPHPSPAPSSPQGCTGVSLVPTTQPRCPPGPPPLPTSPGQPWSSSHQERIFGRKQLKRASMHGPFGLPGAGAAPCKPQGSWNFPDHV